MRIKWHFRNEHSTTFSEIPSSWKPPRGHPNHEIFKTCEKPLGYSNLLREEWGALRSLADDRNLIIKKADKGSCIVVWDRSDYVMKAEKQLNDTKLYKKYQ